MGIKERTARMAQNLLSGIPDEIRSRRTCSCEAVSEALGGIEKIADIDAIRKVATRTPADVTPDGLLYELLWIAASDLAASGKAAGAALLRQMYCLDER